MTLTEIMDELTANTIEVEGAIGEVTRQAYQDRYNNMINPSQFVPTLYFNVENASVSIINSNVISFTQDDIFTADDWICINRTDVA